MQIQFDYSGMKQFSKGFHQLTLHWPRWLRTFLNDQARDFLNRVRKRTPVDTGRLKRSWRLHSIAWRGNQLVATFINDANDGRASYASFVEEGHATPYHAGAGPGSGHWVRGYFMLRYTEKEMERLVPQRLKSEVKALFKRYGVG